MENIYYANINIKLPESCVNVKEKTIEKRERKGLINILIFCEKLVYKAEKGGRYL